MPAGRRGSAAVRRGRAGTLPAKAVAHKRGTLGNAAAPGLLEMQRSRLVAAATGVIAEYGSATTSVAMICARAGVSRRTYYEIFDNREQCIVAILTGVELRMEREIGDATAAAKSWSERVRAGLAAILALLEGEPGLASVCLLESQRGERLMLAERNRILMRLARAIDAGARQDGDSRDAGPLTAEALVGACVAVLQARLAGHPREPEAPRRRAAELEAVRTQPAMLDLLGELMALIVLPYEGAAAARRERRRPVAPAAPVVHDEKTERKRADGDALAGLSMRLTYRTAAVLQAVAELSDQGLPPSNRQIADRAEVRDQGQMSKLLSRLQSHGLLANAAKGADARGEANSWTLTSRGRQLLNDIGLGGREAQRSAA